MPLASDLGSTSCAAKPAGTSTLWAAAAFLIFFIIEWRTLQFILMSMASMSEPRSDADTFSARSIVRAIDEKLCKTSVERYRAFRLLSSDLGHVFFKSLSGAKFKLKAAKAVQASKDAYCRQHDVEFCFV